jgi:hypothetical protein
VHGEVDEVGSSVSISAGSRLSDAQKQARSTNDSKWTEEFLDLDYPGSSLEYAGSIIIFTAPDDPGSYKMGRDAPMDSSFQVNSQQWTEHNKEIKKSRSSPGLVYV